MQFRYGVRHAVLALLRSWAHWRESDYMHLGDVVRWECSVCAANPVAHTKPDCNTDTLSDAEPDTVADAVPNALAYPFALAEPDAEPDTVADTVPDALAHPFALAEPDTKPDAEPTAGACVPVRWTGGRVRWHLHSTR